MGLSGSLLRAEAEADAQAHERAHGLRTAVLGTGPGRPGPTA
ncbi:hypothetical protein [Streptomyces sp. NPDC096033]